MDFLGSLDSGWRVALGRSGEVFVGKAISSKDKEEIQRLRYEADKRMTQGYNEAFARYTSGLCDASALDEWEMEVEEAEEDEVVAAQPEVRAEESCSCFVQGL